MSSDWFFREELSRSVGFAVWVLQQDGLAVPPFDTHPAGDRSLRAVGLTEATWREWLGEITQAESRLINGNSLARRDDVWREVDPVRLWAGDGQARDRLATLWAVYRPIGEAWADALTSRKRRERISAGEDRRLWRGLEPLRRRGAALTVFPVSYPLPGALAVPPAACVAAISPGDRGGHRFVDSVVEAAQVLVGL